MVISTVRRNARPLKELREGTLEYNTIRQTFFEGWYHKEQKKSPRILRILQVRPNRLWRRRFIEYRRSVSQRRKWSKVPLKMLWHGTKAERYCPVLDEQLLPSPKKCKLCKIITTTLKRSKSGMFGPAIYLTNISSKSDIFTKKTKGRRAIVLFRVVVGKAYLATTELKHIRGAPLGHDSVLAAAAKVKTLKYGDHAIYRRRATLPAYVVVYR